MFSDLLGHVDRKMSEWMGGGGRSLKFLLILIFCSCLGGCLLRSTHSTHTRISPRHLGGAVSNTCHGSQPIVNPFISLGVEYRVQYVPYIRMSSVLRVHS